LITRSIQARRGLAVGERSTADPGAKPEFPPRLYRGPGIADSHAMADPKPRSGPFLLAMLVWFALACAAGATGRVSTLTPPQPQLMIAALSVLLLVSGWVLPGLRAWVRVVNLRGFVAFHVTRFVGILFLLMSARGELSPEWAVPAGWGDIAVALGALLIAVFMRRPETRPDLVRLWNLIGLIDIVAVVVTAARIGLRDPAGLAPLLRFPMSLVPTFIVPVVFATHCWMALRLQPRSRPTAATPAV
jgi:hypothetical protein